MFRNVELFLHPGFYWDIICLCHPEEWSDEESRKHEIQLINKVKMKKEQEVGMAYEAPVVEVIKIEVERGFASTGLPDYEYDGDPFNE